jgi:hypothetical protein
LLQNVGEYQLDTARTELDEAGRAQVLDAYSKLQLGADTQCTPGAEAFTLDVAPRNGVDLLFADVEHSACPFPRLQRGSFVGGLNELFAALELLYGVEREPR